MMAFVKVIAKRWPHERKQILNNIKPFFEYPDELMVQNGLRLRRQRIAIFSAMWLEMKMEAHTGHLDINICL